MYMGGRPENDPLQGLCQGNGAAPACWIMLSSLMMQVYRTEGHLSSLQSPMSSNKIEFMGEIHVDDTDLLMIIDNKYNYKAVCKQAQINLNKWAHLLNATGGTLNPAKCYWYMISYVYQDGSWQYDTTSSTLKLTIPLPDGTTEEIAQLTTTEVQKMLGVWLSPNGLDTLHLQEVVVGKVAKWTGWLKNAHLPTHLAWTAYCHQLWPGVKYGLCTLENNKSEMDCIFHKLEFQKAAINGHQQTY